MLCKYQKSIKLLTTLKSYKWLSFTVLKYPFINETVSRGELQQRVCKTLAPWSRGGGVLLEILSGGVPRGSPNTDPISDQKKYFPHPFSDQTFKIHTPVQTWPLGRNNVFIT